jgi:hypothetical protein
MRLNVTHRSLTGNFGGLLGFLAPAPPVLPWYTIGRPIDRRATTEIPMAKKSVHRAPSARRQNPTGTAATRSPFPDLDQALRDLLASPEAKRLRKRGRTWTEGEGWNLAEAFVRWIGPAAGLAVVFVDPLEPEHVTAQVGDLYLDGEGISTEKQLLARAEEWGLDEAEVEPWHKHHAELLAECGTRREEKRVERLAALLERRLGPASRWGLPGTGPRGTRPAPRHRRAQQGGLRRGR